MKLWIKYLLFGLFSYLLFLMIRLPAGMAYGWLEGKMQPAALSSLEGTLWSGRAAELHFRDAMLGEVEWSFSPSSLFNAGLGFSFILSGEQIHAEGETGITIDGAPYFSPLEGIVDARLLERVLQFNLGRVKGDIEYQMESLDLSQEGHISSAFGQFIWKEAAIAQPLGLELGDVEFSVVTEESDIIIDFSGEGALTIDGRVIVEPDGRFTVNGLVLPQPSAPEEVITALRSFGRETADGKIELEYTGRL